MSSPAPLPPPPPLADLLAEGPLALFLDFDGTLVAIAARPDAIEVPEGLARRLERLSTRLDGCFALVSGRALKDLESHLGPVSVAQAGSHGADQRLADGSVLGDAARGLDPETIAEVADYARAHDLVFETKSHGCALHYRTRPAAGEAVDAFIRAIAGTRPVFVGDDITDEDGFAACEELSGFGILVGTPRESAAQFALLDVDAVHNWLEL